MFILDTGNATPLNTLAFSPDGRFLALSFETTGAMWRIQVWDLVTHELVCGLMNVRRQITRLLFSSCGKVLFVSVFGVGVWFAEIATGRHELIRHAQHSVRMDLTSLNILLVSTCYSDDVNPSVSAWDVNDPLKPVRLWEFTEDPLTPFCEIMCPSPDGNNFLALEWRKGAIPPENDFEPFIRDTESLNYYPIPDFKGMLMIRSTHTCKKIHCIKLRALDYFALYYHLDENILTVSNSQIVCADIQTGEIKQIVQSPASSRFREFILHPNRRHYVSLHDVKKFVNVWDVATLQIVRTYKWPFRNGCSLAVSPDGVLCAIGDSQGKVVVWDWEE